MQYGAKLNPCVAPDTCAQPMMQMRKLDALEMSWKGGDAPFSMREW